MSRPLTTWTLCSLEPIRGLRPRAGSSRAPSTLRTAPPGALAAGAQLSFGLERRTTAVMATNRSREDTWQSAGPSVRTLAITDLVLLAVV